MVTQNAADDHQLFDTDANGQADYAYRLGPDGRIAELQYLDEHDGAPSETVDLTVQRHFADRHLIIVIDSVPFEVISELYQHGHFRLFYPPQRSISTFPAMTDPALSEFVGAGPTPGVEAGHVLNGRLLDGMHEYMRARNSPWISLVAYHLPIRDHVWSYLFPSSWLAHELRCIEQTIDQAGPGETITYIVSSSGLGMHRGRTGHQQALLLVDQFCQMLTRRYHGRLHITLASDHGHVFGPYRRVRLGHELERAGYHQARQLHGAADVAVPELGLVSMAAVYCANPADVARDLVGMTGVELAAFQAPDGAVIVLSPDGQARIEHSDTGYRYRPEFGDPLQLIPVMAQLNEQGRVAADGTIDDHVLFAATATHVYPDSLDRLWSAWHGLFDRPPAVIVSLAPGWMSGSGFLADFIDVQATHGNLGRASSTGFVMSTYGQIASPVRIRDVRSALQLLEKQASESARHE